MTREHAELTTPCDDFPGWSLPGYEPSPDDARWLAEAGAEVRRYASAAEAVAWLHETIRDERAAEIFGGF
jgi:hypothetical protein